MVDVISSDTQDRMRQNEEGKQPRPRFFIRRVLLVACRLSLVAIAWFIFEVCFPHTTFSGTKQIEVPQGFGSRQIGALLRDEGVIQSKWAFVVYATIRNQASSLKPGTFEFSASLRLPEILSTLVAGGPYSNERVLTIPEGWNLRDIGLYLEKSGVGSAEDFWRIAGYPARVYGGRNADPLPQDFSGEFSFLEEKPRTVGLEGYLFPDTYRVFRTATMEDVVQKMVANFDRRVDAGIRSDILRQKKTLFQVLMIASLVEKEVTSGKDRALVAGILWKRLELGIPLQVDASLVYIRGHNDTALTNQDKMISSSYNTYANKGYPIGPISNPGLSAIKAAIYPAASSYLYYLTPKDGTVIYSRTLEEHNKAKALYL